MTAVTRKLDGKIVECKFNQKTNSWSFMRERTDKTFPNHSSTAKGVWDSIIHPVHKKDLLNYIEKFKYRSSSQQQQQQQRKRPHQNGNTTSVNNNFKEPPRKK